MLLPESDRHFPPQADYQAKARKAALKYAKQFNLAIDIGAHVGFWSTRLAEAFARVVAFEPVKDNWQCLIKNVPDNVDVYTVALGAKNGHGRMENPAPTNSGAWELKKGKDIQIQPLDVFNLAPDLIKIDVQGSEFDVLRGAVQTLLAWKPVLIVECQQNGVIDPKPITYLNWLGASLVETIGKDSIFIWEDQ